MSANLFNNLFAIYRNIKRHALSMLRKNLNIDLKVNCEACDVRDIKLLKANG